jgi:hypothetical protein
MEYVWRIRNRAVNIEVPGAIREPLSETKAHVLDCKFRSFKGLSGIDWACKWLFNTRRRPANLLTTIKLPADKCKPKSGKRQAFREMRYNASKKKSGQNPFVAGTGSNNYC